MLLRFNYLIRLNLHELSRGKIFVLTIILLHAKSSQLLSSTMTLAEFVQDDAQFFVYCCLDIGDQIFQFCLLWDNKSFKNSNKKCNKLWRIRVAEEKWSLHKVWKMDTEVATWLPIHIVLFIALKFSSCKQTDSMSKIANFRMRFSWFLYLIPKETNLLKVCFQIH